jgi:hypothetical protein
VCMLSAVNQQGTGEELAVVGQVCPELRVWIHRVLNVQSEALTSALTFSTLFPMPPTVLGCGWGDSEQDFQRWRLVVERSDDCCARCFRARSLWWVIVPCDLEIELN